MLKHQHINRVTLLIILISIYVCGCGRAGAITRESESDPLDNSTLTGEQALTKGNEYLESYADGLINYKDCYDYLLEAKNTSATVKEVDGLLTKLDVIFESKKAYAMAEASLKNADYAEAIKYYALVVPEDKENYALSKGEITKLLDKVLIQAEELASTYFYTQAIEVLEECNSHISNQQLSDRILQYETALKAYECYEAPVDHIFFHSLIADVDRAFDGGYQEEGYNKWMCTVEEASQIFNYLYERQYVLISIHELYDIVKEDDQVTLKSKELRFPKGKKPIVLSLDDINYYKFMENEGFADRLVVDDNGKVSNVYIDQEGKEWIGRTYDIIPLLDQFVEEHPDFSYKGAKGTIALTGYEGILGYRTDLYDSETIVQDTEEALKVVEVLKKTGWNFACHGYGHLDVGKISLNTLKKDTAKWKKEVMSLIGDTNVYIYPYGGAVYPEDPKFDYLLEEGFNVLCGVSGYQYNRFKDSAFLMSRRNIDGYTLHYRPKLLEDLIDPYEVIDKRRPAFDYTS